MGLTAQLRDTLASPDDQCFTPIALLRFFNCRLIDNGLAGGNQMSGWYFCGMRLGSASSTSAAILAAGLLAMWEDGLLSHYYRRFVQANLVNLRLMSKKPEK